MTKEITNIQLILIDALKKRLGPLRIREEKEEKFEVCGTIEAMQGKKKVDGFYFASVIPKKKDCRLYFFPIYTHSEAYADLSPEWRKFLKGKSCFHVSSMNEDLAQELDQMVDKGIKLYQKEGWLAKGV